MNLRATGGRFYTVTNWHFHGYSFPNYYIIFIYFNLNDFCKVTRWAICIIANIFERLDMTHRKAIGYSIIRRSDIGNRTDLVPDLDSSYIFEFFLYFVLTRSEILV